MGEILTPVELPERWFLILLPDCHVSTAEIFSHQQLTRNSFPIKMAAFFEGDPVTIASNLSGNSTLRWIRH